MAEALFNYYTQDLPNLSASSCGLYGDGVSSVSDNAKAALSEIGIEFSHTSTPISEELLKESDYVIGMTANHARSIISNFPEYSDKVYTMPIDITDPYGGDLQTYRNCCEQIEHCIKQLIKTILGE